MAGSSGRVPRQRRQRWRLLRRHAPVAALPTVGARGGPGADRTPMMFPDTSVRASVAVLAAGRSRRAPPTPSSGTTTSVAAPRRHRRDRTTRNPAASAPTPPAPMNASPSGPSRSQDYSRFRRLRSQDRPADPRRHPGAGLIVAIARGGEPASSSAEVIPVSDGPAIGEAVEVL